MNSTTVAIDGEQFLINGRPTYEGREYDGRRVSGLLFNTRMANAIFDDENRSTRTNWRYPDTGTWDPDRNTDEFCAALPGYAAHGVLGVTVGLQGGGSIYNPDVYDHYVNTAFAPDGEVKPDYLDRLERVLSAADAAGMVVIVNFFYWRQLQWLEGDSAILRAAEEAADWLLEGGHTNVLVDLMNEFQEGDGLLESQRIGEVIQLIRKRSHSGRRLLVSSSVHPEKWQPEGDWDDCVDFYIPHGNNQNADELRKEIRALRSSRGFQENPRPILINEDSIHLDSLEAALDEYASWGYYSQGYGCGGSWKHGRFDWLAAGREEEYGRLSGFQTMPTNWSINTDEKREFFSKVATITGRA